MIKEGDKVICIKDFYFRDWCRPNMTCYTEGKLYEIRRYDSNDKTVHILSDDGETGVWFKINELSDNYFSVYSEISDNYFGVTFILMADWREKQIKSVLDD